MVTFVIQQINTAIFPMPMQSLHNRPRGSKVATLQGACVCLPQPQALVFIYMGENSLSKQPLFTRGRAFSSISKGPVYPRLLHAHKDLMTLGRNGLPSQPQVVSVPTNGYTGLNASCHLGIGNGCIQFYSSNCHFNLPDRRHAAGRHSGIYQLHSTL